jgi:sugar phosphate isomerase/epimerase
MFLSCSILGGLRSNADSETYLVDQIKTLVHVCDAGYRYVELWHTNHPNWVGRTIQRALKNFKLIPYSIHLPKFLVAYDDEQFGLVNDVVFPFIKELEIQVAVLHPPGKIMPDEVDWPKRFDTLLTHAENAGCILTLENVPYIKNVDKYILTQLEMYSDRPLGVTIDFEHMCINGSDIRALLNMFGENILNIHFRDSNGSLVNGEGYRNYIPPGQGIIDLYDAVKALHETGYSKALTIEIPHKSNNIIEAKAYAEECLRRAEEYQDLD